MKVLLEKIKSVRFYQCLMYVVVTALLTQAVFSTWINIYQMQAGMRSYILNQGLQMAQNVANQSGLALISHTAENAKTAIQNALSFPDVFFIQIIDARQDELVSQHKLKIESAKDTSYHVLTTSFPRTQAKKVQLEFENDMGWRFIAPVYTAVGEDSPFEAEVQQPKLLGYVRVGILKDTLFSLTKSLLLSSVLVAVGLLVILLSLLYYGCRYLMSPLFQLHLLMQQAELGYFGLRADARKGGSQDLVDMCLAFNSMMVGLEVRESEIIRARDEALRIAALKTQFAAVMSHEIRTPLNGVMGVLELLGDMNLDEHQRSYWDIAYRSACSLMQLVNDVLDFSKMEAGKLKLEMTEGNIQELLEESMGIFMHQAQKKNIQMGYVLDPNVPIFLHYDAVRLRQLLNNLLGNAIKFTEKGEVGIWVSQLSQIDGDSELLFRVTDSGIGMSQEVIKTIFDSFSQADLSTTRKYGGTGLGLSISKNLVELMRGKISVTSEIGKGSCFSFVLTLKAAQKQRLPQSFAQDYAVFKDKPILIIDESLVVRESIKSILMRYDMLCTMAENAEQALNMLEKSLEPYAFILMDITMVDSEGIDLSMCIRRDPRFSRIPLFLLDRSLALVEGCSVYSDGYLSKPLRASRCIEVVRYILSGKGRSCAELLSTNLLGEASVHVKPEEEMIAADGKKPARAVTDSPPSSSDESTKIWRVLVTDDNSVNRNVATKILQKMGFVCEHAENGLEALNAVKLQRTCDESFLFILMDCSMPEMDGFEATRAIREFEQPLDKHTPIIALTANVQEGDRNRCFDAGMDDYLAKPVTAPNLKAKLVDWVPADILNH